MSVAGTHTVLALHGCKPHSLQDPTHIRETAVEALRRSGAEPISHHFKPLQPQGVGGIVVAADSHISMHTRPGQSFASVDIYTRAADVNPDAAAACLAEQLEPSQVIRSLHLVPAEAKADDALYRELAARTAWFTEYHFEGEFPEALSLSYQYAVSREVARRQSPYQDIQVLENPIWGRNLVIDNFMMVTERDERSYHEILAHVPMLLHGSARRVLIVGGGDGGLAREVLRHPRVERIDLVELDRQVVEMSRAHLPSMGRAFDDPRLKVHVQDGTAFVRACENKYDVVLVDATDPLGPGKVLYARDFYADCRSRLTDGGLFAAQGLSPYLQVTEQDAMFGNLRQAFEHVRPFLSTIPTYMAGLWVFALASAQPIDPARFDRAAAGAIAEQCDYYNADLHGAAFCLPNFIRRRLLP